MRKAVNQNSGIFLMSCVRFSNSGRRILLNFCSILRMSSDAFSFRRSISFWQPSMLSRAAVSSSLISSLLAFFAADDMVWSNGEWIEESGFSNLLFIKIELPAHSFSDLLLLLCSGVTYRLNESVCMRTPTTCTAICFKDFFVN